MKQQEPELIHKSMYNYIMNPCSVINISSQLKIYTSILRRILAIENFKVKS